VCQKLDHPWVCWRQQAILCRRRHQPRRPPLAKNQTGLEESWLQPH
jgi:hypothetical protein